MTDTGGSADPGLQPIVKGRSLTVGSITTAVAVVLALVVTMVFSARGPSADEAALRAVLSGAATPNVQNVASAPAAESGSVQPTAEPVTTPSPTTVAPTTVPPTTVAPTTVPPTTVAPTTVPPTAVAVTPLLPPPVPTTAEGNNQNLLLPAGRVTVPVGPGVSFELAEATDSIHLPGISALYASGARTTEIDIFVPVATASGQRLETFDQVINYVETDPLFSSLEKWSPIDWGGYRTAGYSGIMQDDELKLGFYTSAASIGDPSTGWRLPFDLEIWFFDTNAGPVAITSESLLSAEFEDLRDTTELMVQVLATVEIVGG